MTVPLFWPPLPFSEWSLFLGQHQSSLIPQCPDQGSDNFPFGSCPQGSSFFFIFFYFWKRFDLFYFKERVHTGKWEEEQRGCGKNLRQTPCSVQSPTWGSISYEIMNGAKTQSPRLNWATQGPLQGSSFAIGGTQVELPVFSYQPFAGALWRWYMFLLGINIYLMSLLDEIEYGNTQTEQFFKILLISIQVYPITFYFHPPWKTSTWPISAHELNAHDNLCLY